MKRSLLLVVVGLVVSIPLSGCGRAISEAVGAGFGAKSSVVEIDRLPLLSSPPGPVTVEPITSGMNAKVPQQWLTALTTNIRQEVNKAEGLQGQGQPVTVSGQVIHLESSDILGQAMGPDSEVVLRLTARGAGGKVLGVANVVGRARSSTSSGMSDLTKAAGEGVVKWLKKSTMRE